MASIRCSTGQAGDGEVQPTYANLVHQEGRHTRVIEDSLFTLIKIPSRNVSLSLRICLQLKSQTLAMDTLSLTKEAKIYNEEKTVSLTSGAGKTGQPCVKE